MKRPDTFASEEFLRYAAECERMARLARPVKRATRPVRSFTVLPLCLALLANVVVLARG